MKTSRLPTKSKTHPLLSIQTNPHTQVNHQHASIASHGKSTFFFFFFLLLYLKRRVYGLHTIVLTPHRRSRHFKKKRTISSIVLTQWTTNLSGQTNIHAPPPNPSSPSPPEKRHGIIGGPTARTGAPPRTRSRSVCTNPRRECHQHGHRGRGDGIGRAVL